MVTQQTQDWQKIKEYSRTDVVQNTGLKSHHLTQKVFLRVRRTKEVMFGGAAGGGKSSAFNYGRFAVRGRALTTSAILFPSHVC